ncbi:MAG: FecR domain-containing protein, partial [Pseudomonadota bacterium]
MNILFRVFFRVLPVSMLVILINTALGWSAVQVGQVGILRGEVEAISIDEKVRSLQIKSPVYQDETIRTGKDGQLQIFFEDESIFTLGPSSEVKIDKFVFDPAKAKGRFLVKVGRGAFRLVTGLISRNSPKDVTVETETAVIGVRGCYLASVLGDQGKLTVLYLGGERGRERGISIGNKLGTINITTSGFGTTVKSSQDPPSPPMRFSTENIKEILAPTELGERQEQKEKGEPRKGEERKETREEKQEVKAPPPPDALPPPPRRPPPQETTPLVRTTAPDPSITTGLQGEQLTGVKQEGTVSLEGFYVMFSGSDKWQGDISGTGKGSTRALTLLRSGETSQELSLTGSHINLSASSLMVYNEETSTSNTLWGHDLNELFRAYDVWGGLFTFEAWDVKGSDTTVYIIGYAGTKTLGALPTSGIGIYKGQAGHTSTGELFGRESRQGDYEDVEARINWQTGKVFLAIKPNETGEYTDLGTMVFLEG